MKKGLLITLTLLTMIFVQCTNEGMQQMGRTKKHR